MDVFGAVNRYSKDSGVKSVLPGYSGGIVKNPSYGAGITDN